MSMRQTRLQLLWDMAQTTFGQGKPPSPHQITALQTALSQVPLHELGLDAILNEHGVASVEPSVSPSSTLTSTAEFDLDRSGITYYHIHEDTSLSLGIFFLPSNSRIPLHNHPGMTVLSRVLYGNLHIQSYDWADPLSDSPGLGAPRDAITAVDKIASPTDPPTVLFPTSGGNLHEFTATTPCAVLDLLSPPYSSDEGRDCTYYKVAGRRVGSNKVELQEYEPPEDFNINSSVYTGVDVHTRPGSNDYGSDGTHMDGASEGSSQGGERLGVSLSSSPTSPRSASEDGSTERLAERLDAALLSENGLEHET